MPKPIHESGGVLEAAKSGAAPTRRNIQIITPGWGASGYYSAEVLEEAATNRVIPAGTKMYLNHPTETEKFERPARDVEKIAAVLIEDAAWDGTRLTAPADLVGPHAELIEALAPYIGVSIYGDATDITMGEAEGRYGRIIEGLAHVKSVDFVTNAGRGGMVLLESASPSLVNARAVAHGITEATVNDTREQLQNVLRDAYGGEKTYVWVRDFDDATVWFDVEDGDGSGTYGQAYASADGVVTLSGDRTEVRVSTSYVPATRPDSKKTTEESQEDTMPKIEIDEAEHQRLVEAAGRVETLEAENAAEKSRADKAEQDLATKVAEAAAASRPKSPREVMEARDREKDNRIAVLEAKDKARDIVNEELSNAWLPSSTIGRLTTTLMGDLPMVEGKLDEQALRNAVIEARTQHELEAAETLEAAGVGIPRGLSAQRPTGEGDTDRYKKQIAEGLQNAFALSENEAATAVKGR